MRPGFLAGAAAVVVLTCAAGCASAAQLNPKLEKVARAVPVPSGVSFVDVGRTQMSTGLGTTYEVYIDYANPSMPCDQLHSAWLAVLNRANRQTYAVSAQQIFIENSDYTVIVDMGFAAGNDCSKPSVSVQSGQQLS
jgi:hypothetical protein